MAANITHGMNPDEVEALGHRLQTIGDEINHLVSELNGKVNDASWQGPDSVQFKQQWWPEHRGHLTAVVNDLKGFGQSALNNASAQRTASGQ